MKLAALLLLFARMALAQDPFDPFWNVRAATNAATFSPNDISGLVRWFDATTVVAANNDPLDTGTDLTGNSDFRQTGGGGGVRPLYKSSVVGFGSKPAVYFNGLQATWTNVNLADSTKTIFIAAFRVGTASATMFTLTTGDAQVYDNGSGTWHYYQTDTACTAGNPLAAGALLVRFNSTSSADIRTQSGALANFDPNDAYDNTGLMSFGSNFEINLMEVYLGEFLVYDRALTTAECNQVGNYLAPKWNFTWTDL